MTEYVHEEKVLQDMKSNKEETTTKISKGNKLFGKLFGSRTESSSSKNSIEPTIKLPVSIPSVPPPINPSYRPTYEEFENVEMDISDNLTSCINSDFGNIRATDNSIPVTDTHIETHVASPAYRDDSLEYIETLNLALAISALEVSDDDLGNTFDSDITNHYTPVTTTEVSSDKLKPLYYNDNKIEEEQEIFESRNFINEVNLLSSTEQLIATDIFDSQLFLPDKDIDTPSVSINEDTCENIFNDQIINNEQLSLTTENESLELTIKEEPHHLPFRFDNIELEQTKLFPDDVNNLSISQSTNNIKLDSPLNGDKAMESLNEINPSESVVNNHNFDSIPLSLNIEDSEVTNESDGSPINSFILPTLDVERVESLVLDGRNVIPIGDNTLSQRNNYFSETIITQESSNRSGFIDISGIRRRQHLPFQCTLAEGGKWKCVITMKQWKLPKNAQSPQGNRPDFFNLGFCATNDLGKDLCLTVAPPLWVDKKDPNGTSCAICNFRFGMFRQGHHCRNCGYIICNNCSDKRWPSSMLPATYYNNEKVVRICFGCNFLMEKFVDALRHGNYESSIRIYNSGNINLHNPLTVFSSQPYPV